MARKRRFGPELEAIELEELSSLLGIEAVSIADSRRAFQSAVAEGREAAKLRRQQLDLEADESSGRLPGHRWAVEVIIRSAAVQT